MPEVDAPLLLNETGTVGTPEEAPRDEAEDAAARAASDAAPEAEAPEAPEAAAPEAEAPEAEAAAPEAAAPAKTRTRELAIVIAVAIVVVLGSELALRRICPPKYVREIQDAMVEYKREDPTVLVLGSSHARTFAYMDTIARERTQGRARIMSVPLEWGKFRSYEWVLEHRLVPLLDAKKPDGSRARPSLRHFVLTTAWWDACWYDGDPEVFNLPSRAWTLDDFLSAVREKGLNDHSRNYVTSRWGDLWHGSILISDRGHGRLAAALRATVKPLPESALVAQHEKKLADWQAMVERGESCINHPAELAALDRILSFAEDRGWDLTLMLYPMMPSTMTPKGIERVQRPFIRAMREMALLHRARFIDATFDKRLTDDDFQEDFDHLKPASHVRYSNDLLDHELSFLLDQPVAALSDTDEVGR